MGASLNDLHGKHLAVSLILSLGNLLLLLLLQLLDLIRIAFGTGYFSVIALVNLVGLYFKVSLHHSSYLREYLRHTVGES